MKHKITFELSAVARERVERAVSGVLAGLGDNVEGYKATIAVDIDGDVTGGVDALIDRIKMKLGTSRGVGVKIKHVTTEEHITSGNPWDLSPMAAALQDLAPSGSIESVTLSGEGRSVTLTKDSGKGIEYQ